MSADTTPLGPFAGMNNRLPDHQLGITERGQRAGDYLRNAVNVDLTDAGTLQRRKGSTLVVPGADCHSLWSDEQGAYYVDGSSLKTFPTGALVRNGLTPGRPVSFVRFPNGDVYWTNSVVLERIRGGVSEPAISGSVTLLSASTDGTITVGSALYPIKYSSASVLNESGLRATVLDATTLAQVLNTSGVVCTNGVITITDAALIIGNTCHLAVKAANGWLGVSDGVTAS